MDRRPYLFGAWLCLVGLAMVSFATVAQSDGTVTVELEPFVEGLEQPTFVTHSGDGSGQL